MSTRRRADRSRGMRRRDVAFWVVCLAWIGVAALGGRVEAATGLPVGSGSWLALLVFAVYTAVAYFLLPHLDAEEATARELDRHALPPREPETVERALARVASRRAGASTVSTDAGPAPTTHDG